LKSKDIFIIFVVLLTCFVFSTKLINASGIDVTHSLRGELIAIDEAGITYSGMAKEIICGIYKITSPSDKIYIGKAVNVYSRWGGYRGLDCKGQPKLYNSLKNTGGLHMKRK